MCIRAAIGAKKWPVGAAARLKELEAVVTDDIGYHRWKEGLQNSQEAAFEAEKQG